MRSQLKFYHNSKLTQPENSHMLIAVLCSAVVEHLKAFLQYKVTYNSGFISTYFACQVQLSQGSSYVSILGSSLESYPVLDMLA